HTPRDARLGILAGLGLLSALLYAFGITARYPLAAGLRTPRVSWYTLSGYSLRAGLFFALVVGLLILCYAVALRQALRLGGRSAFVPLAIIVGGWLLSSAALLGAYPGESLDIFDYTFRGRMLVEYGASPLAIAPSAYWTKPFYPYITWRGQVDTYGPLWEYASGLVAWVVSPVLGRGDSQVAYIAGYRLLAILLAGLGGLIIALMVRRSDPAHVPAALLAWLWNPLLLVATAIGAHNDIVMMLAVLAALLLFQRRRWVTGLLALALAAHVKLTALLILPVLGLWLARRCGWRRALRDGAIALALALPLSWLLYAPLGGWITLRRMLNERAQLLINSPADLVYHLLQEQRGWSESAAWRAVTLGATILFFVGAAAVLAWLWRSGRRLAPDQESVASDELLWRGCVTVTLLYLLVGSFWFQHWYLLWILAPSALLPASRWTRTLLPAYCLGILWGSLANTFLRNLPPRQLSVTQTAAINVLSQVLPLLCVIGALLLLRIAPRLLVALRRSRAGLPYMPARASAQYEMDDRP
ncbi:MAG TPA: glycosyltransferase 87 family protein, partial [Roseiflexaceae bacterium]|nr:glycosyltransferase 87 family protein [Roseiflexaceae bacterium]